MAIIKLNNPNFTDTAKLDNTNIADIEELRKKTLSIEELLIFTTEHNCSDLYIKVFDYPYISRYGKIIKLPCSPISRDAWSIFYDKYILNELNAGYVRQKLLDTSVAIRVPETSENYGKYPNNQYRYRVSFGFSEERNIATFRMIKPEQPTFETINYNNKCIEALKTTYAKPSGICFMTGPTGSGKSTTLAACINSFTQTGNILDNKVFITLEDPIEQTFSNTDSVKIVQKELGKDFISFDLGIKASLREHPNVIIVGECRDKEVICAAIEAARTGHLVSTTFHSSDVASTISRLLYHLDNDKNLTLDLLLQLNVILSQKMIKQNDKYLVDTQFMIFNDYVTDKLIEITESPNTALIVEVNKLIHDPELLEQGLVKDWDYKELH